jgi:endonuclease G
MAMNADHLERLRRMLEQVDPSGQAQGLPENLESHLGAADGPVTEERTVSPKHLEAEFAQESLEVLRRGEQVDDEQRYMLEAVVLPYRRPVVDVVLDRMKTEQLTQTWRHLAEDGLRLRLEQCLLSVGRVDVPSLPSLPYAGTSFVVGPDLVMTNRHVAQIFAQGVGTRDLRFQPDQGAAVDFYHEIGRPEKESLEVERVVMIHPYWDMAMLKVRGISERRKPLALSSRP